MASSLMCGLLAIRRSESGGNVIVAKIGWKEEPAEKSVIAGGGLLRSV